MVNSPDGVLIKYTTRKEGKVMALIKCPECGKDISDKADKCINCGCPVSEMVHSVPPELKSFTLVCKPGMFDPQPIKGMTIDKKNRLLGDTIL